MVVVLCGEEVSTPVLVLGTVVVDTMCGVELKFEFKEFVEVKGSVEVGDAVYVTNVTASTTACSPPASETIIADSCVGCVALRRNPTSKRCSS
jgi:hypothetical protein